MSVVRVQVTLMSELLSELLPCLAYFMANDAAFNGQGALILHLLQPFYRLTDTGTGMACRECPSQVRSPFLCSTNFLNNFHIKKHGQNCYDYIS